MFEYVHLQQAVENGEQLCEGTHRLAEPVSNTTLNIWAGEPILISPKYCVYWKWKNVPRHCCLNSFSFQCFIIFKKAKKKHKTPQKNKTKKKKKKRIVFQRFSHMLNVTFKANDRETWKVWLIKREYFKRLIQKQVHLLLSWRHLNAHPRAEMKPLIIEVKVCIYLQNWNRKRRWFQCYIFYHMYHL